LVIAIDILPPIGEFGKMTEKKPKWREAFKSKVEPEPPAKITIKPLPEMIPEDLRARLDPVLSMRGVGSAKIYDEFKDWLIQRSSTNG
jgi:hypothetical protein